MIYDLCLAFKKKGCDVTLAASDLYKPSENESYPFNIIWMRTRLTKLFPPHTLPYCPEVKKIAKSGNFDLIITSEVFSLNSLKLALCLNASCNNKRFFKSYFCNNAIPKFGSKPMKNTIMLPSSCQTIRFLGVQSAYCCKKRSGKGIYFKILQKCIRYDYRPRR